MSFAKYLSFDVPGFGRLKTEGGEIEFSGTDKKLESSDQGPMGISKKPTGGKLTFKVGNVPGISGKKLEALEDINVTVEDGGGKTWLCRRATTTNRVKLSGGWYSVEMDYFSEEEVS